MKKREKLSAAEKKIKRRKIWGIICISLGTFMLVEGLVLGLVLKETAILLSMGIEGAILLAVGILLRAKNKGQQTSGDKTAKDKINITETAEKINSCIEDEHTYRLSEIIDEDARIEIYANLSTLAKIYHNFFPDWEYTKDMRDITEKFSDPEVKATKEGWLFVASRLEIFSVNEFAKNYKEIFITKGVEKIKTYFSDK